MEESIAKKSVVYTTPGVDRVTVRRDVPFARGLMMDVYSPPDAGSARLPAVVLAAGYRDAGFEKHVGCRFKEMGSTVSWARLIAASGMVAVAYTNEEPAADVRALLHHIRQNAASLRIDEKRIGVWASSGNVPVVLSLLMQETREDLRCAVLLYPCTLEVAEAAKTFGFANPSEGRTVDDLAADIPLFIARAGRDQTPGLNEALDRFACKAIGRNLPITIVNHPAVPHAFDLFDDSADHRTESRLHALSPLSA
jgi:hypothetical protein